MVTDRPSFSVGPGTVPGRCIQFETDYTFSFEDGHPNVKTHTFPETLVRIGLTDRVDIRLVWPTLTIIENGTDVHGLNNLAPGAQDHGLSAKGAQTLVEFLRPAFDSYRK